jgi:hypothetical protein
MKDKMQRALKEAGDWMISRELHLDDYAGVISITLSPREQFRIHLTEIAALAAGCGVGDNVSVNTIELSNGELFQSQQDDGVMVSWIKK